MEGHAGHPLQRLRVLHPHDSGTWATTTPRSCTTNGIRHPPGATYGALPLIVGTLQSSFIALVLAVPVGIGTALIVVEKLPPRLSSAVGFCLEVLAGIPSVVYRPVGVLHPRALPVPRRRPARGRPSSPTCPSCDFFRGVGPHNSAGNGTACSPSGVVLAIMILPIIAATTRDLLRQVPRATVEGAVALGHDRRRSAAGRHLPLGPRPG